MVVFVLLWLGVLLAAGLQNESLFSLRLWGTKPDFLIIFVACAGVLYGRGWGVVAGLMAGHWQALMQGMDPGSLLVSRMAVGYLCGTLEPVLVKDNLGVAILMAGGATWAAELLRYLIAPRLPVVAWMAMTGAESVLNALLAVPIYSLALAARRVAQRYEQHGTAISS